MAVKHLFLREDLNQGYTKNSGEIDGLDARFSFFLKSEAIFMKDCMHHLDDVKSFEKAFLSKSILNAILFKLVQCSTALYFRKHINRLNEELEAEKKHRSSLEVLHLLKVVRCGCEVALMILLCFSVARNIKQREHRE